MQDGAEKNEGISVRSSLISHFEKLYNTWLVQKTYQIPELTVVSVKTYNLNIMAGSIA